MSSPDSGRQSLPVVDLRGRCTGQRGNAVKVKPVASYTNLKLIIRKGKEKEEGRKHSKYLVLEKARTQMTPMNPQNRYSPVYTLSLAQWDTFSQFCSSKQGIIILYCFKFKNKTQQDLKVLGIDQRSQIQIQARADHITQMSPQAYPFFLSPVLDTCPKHGQTCSRGSGESLQLRLIRPGSLRVQKSWAWDPWLPKAPADHREQMSLELTIQPT